MGLGSYRPHFMAVSLPLVIITCCFNLLVAEVAQEVLLNLISRSVQPLAGYH